jgi:hypothetical protein
MNNWYFIYDEILHWRANHLLILVFTWGLVIDFYIGVVGFNIIGYPLRSEIIIINELIIIFWGIKEKGGRIMWEIMYFLKIKIDGIKFQRLSLADALFLKKLTINIRLVKACEILKNENDLKSRRCI